MLHTEHSEELYSRAKELLPGGVNSPVRAFLSVGGTPRFIHHAKGQYLYDDKALEKYRKTHTGNFTLQRYKGLGEMDADQLWETTLNPETRILKRVEIEDAKMASDVTSMLMGSDVGPRREFFHEHAHDAELDLA